MTPQEREVMQMALDALEHGLPIIEDFGGKEQLQLQHKAIAVLYEALRVALANEFNPDWDAMAVMVEEQQRMAKRIEELESALAQPEQEELGEIIPADEEQLNRIAKLVEQEPVACPYCHYSHTLGAVFFDQNCAGCVKRMTAPPQREWQGLTDDDFIGLTTQQIFAMKFAEEKLREKNS